MDIYDITIQNIRYGGLYSDEVENLRHIKQLPFLSVVRVTEGDLLFSLENREPKAVGEGGLFIAPSNKIQTIIHKVNKDTGFLTADWIFLEATVNGIFFLDEIFAFPEIIRTENAEKWDIIFDGMKNSEDICDKKIFGYKLIKLLTENGTPTNFSDNIEISEICRYIHNNYEKEITVSDLAKKICMSESNFYAAFRKHTGISPMSYVNNCRIAAATQMLLYSGKSISEIAVDSGIPDPYYFSRIFRRKYGVSPREYRKQNHII